MFFFLLYSFPLGFSKEMFFILSSVPPNLNMSQRIDMIFFSQQILNNYVQFEVYSGLSQVASLKMTQTRVSDGEWHHLLIELKSAKDGKDIKYLAVMSLDYGMYQVRQHYNFATKHYRNIL